jgi:sugar lactone lactonase YvrE
VSGMPRQVMSCRLRATAGLLSAVAVLAAGCVSTGRASRREFQPVPFPDSQTLPRVVVYGNLRYLLPDYDRTPALDLWLYGPNDYGKTILRNPQGMALLDQRLLVCDQGQSDIVGVDLATGKSLTWGDADHRPRCPVDIAVDEQGCVYVADTTLRSVIKYGPDQRFNEELKPAGKSADTFRPASVCIARGVLYIGNIGDHRVDRWDLAGRQWLEPLAPPTGQPGLIAPTGLAVTVDNVLLIVDAVGGRVQRVQTDGRWLDPIGRPGRQKGEFIRPKHVCVTCAGLILVTDAGRQSVLVFDKDGRFFTEIREQPKQWTGLTLPAGLLALSPEQFPTPPRLVNGASESPDGYVIVSDSLSSDSLMLLGVFMQPERGPNHAR